MNLSKCIVESAVITDLRMGIIKGCKWKGFCICTFMLLIHLKLSCMWLKYRTFQKWPVICSIIDVSFLFSTYDAVAPLINSDKY